MTDKPLYNFRIAPEAIWLIVNTVIGTALVELLLQVTKWQEVGGLENWQTWAVGFAFGLVRTALGAILAAATGGQFLGRGQEPVTHTTG
jgi:hypothetical protein